MQVLSISSDCVFIFTGGDRINHLSIALGDTCTNILGSNCELAKLLSQKYKKQFIVSENVKDYDLSEIEKVINSSLYRFTNFRG